MHALPIIAIVLSTAALLRTRRRSHGSHCGHGHHGCHGHHHGRRHRRRWRGFGPRRWLHRLSEELDLSPAQEKAVREEFRSLREKFGSMREEGGRTRDDLAELLQNDAFDPAGLEALFARHDEHLGAARTELAASLARLHELLDAEQRQRLARLLGSSRRFWGPYR